MRFLLHDTLCNCNAAVTVGCVILYVEAYAAAVDADGGNCLDAVVYCGYIKSAAVHVEEALVCFAFGIGLDAVVATVYGNSSTEDGNFIRL